MSDTERGRVGEALEAIRQALASYVDDAMTEAYGENWDDVVAEDNARRRPDGRRFPVTKSDLYVMLQALIYRRISPWADLKTYPRVRAFASEILSLRNLHAHGDECTGEHVRLADTGSRILAMLGLPIPIELERPATQIQMPPELQAPSALARRGMSGDGLDDELARLGAVGEDLTAIGLRATELSASLTREFHDGLLALDPDRPDFAVFKAYMERVTSSVGEEVLQLLSRLDEIDATHLRTTDPHLALAIHFIRSVVLSPTLHAAALSYSATLQLEHTRRIAAEVERVAALAEESSPTAEDLVSKLRGIEAIESRMPEGMERVTEHNHETCAREVIREASQLADASPFANLAHASASLDLAMLARHDGGWTSEALPHVRDGIARLRFLAGLEPGSMYESALVGALRLEGEICNDLGSPDEAVESFARANEILDRYPAADPAMRL